MKKLLFSAVALVAFSSVSLGNTIEIEEQNISNQIIEDGSPSACVQLARGAVLQAAQEYNLDISRGGKDFQVMMDMYMMIYTDCLNN